MNNKINKLAFTTLIGLTLLSSCRKASTPASTSFPTTPALSASINGTSWSADQISATNGSVGTTNTLIVAGSKSSDGSLVSLTMPNSVTPGTYQIDGTHYALTYNNSAGTYYVANSGTITITDYSNSVVNGNFQGVLPNFKTPSDKVTITNGSFTGDVR